MTLPNDPVHLRPLFNYNELPESSREALPKIKGYGRDHVRFVVAEDFDGKIDGYQLNMRDTTNMVLMTMSNN